MLFTVDFFKTLKRPVYLRNNFFHTVCNVVFSMIDISCQANCKLRFCHTEIGNLYSKLRLHRLTEKQYKLFKKDFRVDTLSRQALHWLAKLA